MTKETVAGFIKAYANGNEKVRPFLGEGGSSWEGEYSAGTWAMCEGIAQALNQEVNRLSQDLSILSGRVQKVYDAVAVSASYDDFKLKLFE